LIAKHNSNSKLKKTKASIFACFCFFIIIFHHWARHLHFIIGRGIYISSLGAASTFHRRARHLYFIIGRGIYISSLGAASTFHRRARHPWRAAKHPPQPRRRVKDAAPYTEFCQDYEKRIITI